MTTVNGMAWCRIGISPALRPARRRPGRWPPTVSGARNYVHGYYAGSCTSTPPRRRSELDTAALYCRHGVWQYGRRRCYDTTVRKYHRMGH
eukprot:746050-Hanusia_phi.AAC.1